MNLLKNLLKKFDLVLVWGSFVLISLYRVISKILPSRCRFYPSCSSYALEMFDKRGFFVGLPKVIWRILRCNPLNDGGYDPVK